MSEETQITARQEAAITALLTSPSLEAAAAVCNVASSTLRRWRQLPEFRAAYDAMRRQLIEHAISRAQERSSAAVDVVLAIMNDTTERGAVRLSAARTLLDFGIQGLNLLDVQRRLEELETAQDEDAGV